MGRNVEVAFVDHETYVSTVAAAGFGGRGQELGEPRVDGGRVLFTLGQQVVCQRLHRLV
jgi:hypothetical protein